MKFALAQMSCSEDADANLAKALEFVDRAADRGADVLGLQECFAYQFFPQVFEPGYLELAQPIDGPIVEAVRAAARKAGIYLLAPIYEKEREGVLYNTTLVIDRRGEIVGKYRKTHLPFSDHFYEKFYFKPGNLGYPVFDTDVGRIGILICYDRHFPDAARVLGLEGAEILFVPIASSRPAAKKAFEIELRAHAIFNQFFVAAVNRVGEEIVSTYFGASMFVDPAGGVIAKASASDDELLVAELDLGEIGKTRRHWMFYRDRRPDLYGPVAEPR